MLQAIFTVDTTGVVVVQWGRWRRVVVGGQSTCTVSILSPYWSIRLRHTFIGITGLAPIRCLEPRLQETVDTSRMRTENSLGLRIHSGFERVGYVSSECRLNTPNTSSNTAIPYPCWTDIRCERPAARRRHLRGRKLTETSYLRPSTRGPACSLHSSHESGALVLGFNQNPLHKPAHLELFLSERGR